jgi:hypothetical protein
MWLRSEFKGKRTTSRALFKTRCSLAQLRPKTCGTNGQQYVIRAAVRPQTILLFIEETMHSTSITIRGTLILKFSAVLFFNFQAEILTEGCCYCIVTLALAVPSQTADLGPDTSGFFTDGRLSGTDNINGAAVSYVFETALGLGQGPPMRKSSSTNPCLHTPSATSTRAPSDALPIPWG